MIVDIFPVDDVSKQMKERWKPKFKCIMTIEQVPFIEEDHKVWGSESPEEVTKRTFSIESLPLMCMPKLNNNVNLSIRIYYIPPSPCDLTPRWICPASTADWFSSQWDLQGSHHDHRLWKPAHVQHILLESQGLPVWSPWRLCGHGANYCCWTRHWSHHRHPHLYHHTIRWASHTHTEKLTHSIFVVALWRSHQVINEVELNLNKLLKHKKNLHFNSGNIKIKVKKFVFFPVFSVYKAWQKN